MDPKTHWDKVYRTRPATEVSGYWPHLEVSLQLIEEAASDRAAHVRQVAHAVKPGGHVIVATFGPEGPTRCSGLDVVRYDPDALHDQFGPAFRLVRHLTELHRTPAGAVQQFTYCYCNVSSASA
jgi:hypothetical protein